MDSRSTHRRVNDRGFTSIQFVLASALALVFFVALANVVVVQYARGAVRSALDQGVRTGSINRSADLCESRIESVLSELLDGTIGDSVTFRCAVSGGLMTATASFTVEAWTFAVADYSLTLTAESTLEPDG